MGVVLLLPEKKDSELLVEFLGPVKFALLSAYDFPVIDELLYP